MKSFNFKDQYGLDSPFVITKRQDGIGVHIFYLEKDQKGIPVNVIYVRDGQLMRQKYTESMVNPKPFLTIGYFDLDNMLPDLLDSLIKFGITPKTAVMGPQEHSALTNHLNDMRKIVSKELGVNL